MLIEIDFTTFKKDLRLKQQGNQTIIFDPIRKKNIILQPEELVRQLVVQYLVQEKNYPLSKIRVEMGLTINGLSKRCDILIFDKNATPFLLVECKSIHVPIDQLVFDQIARYNLKFKVPFLVTTNGLSTFCCKMDYDTEGYEFLKEIPCFYDLRM